MAGLFRDNELVDWCSQRFVVNALMSRWRLVMGGVPHGSVLVLFNVLTAPSASLHVAADTPGGEDAIQREVQQVQAQGATPRSRQPKT